MVTVKRVYLYGVLGVSLVLLLWGLSDLLRFAFDEAGHALGASPAFGGSFAREELSRALALTLVAGGIFGVHLALVRGSLRGSLADAADERACTARAVYFFLLLVGTGAAFLSSVSDFTYQLVGSVAFDFRDSDPLAAFASVIVFGGAWALHLLARGTDLRAVPARLAGDWLTRAYLYGALFVTFAIGALAAGELLTTVARHALGLRPLFEGPDWWQAAVTGSLATACAAAVGWLLHWLLAARLSRAPDPLGIAHRTAGTRRGYLISVVAASALAVLVFASLSLGSAFAELAGSWRSTEGSRLLEDIGGPLLMLAPFVPAWWWHQRRAAREALARADGSEARAVARTLHLAIAVVGLAGLAAGVAWELQVLIDAVVGSGAREGVITTTSLGRDGAQALALAIVGLLLWTPSWARSQRDRAQHDVEAATATSRRAYLLLVSGLAVVAAMASLAYLVWQATRVLLESGEPEDPAWALSVLLVALVVLGYHLWQLRADLRLAQAAVPRAMVVPTAVAGRALETIEISAPVGADFRILNAAIRSELPDGYELRVVSHQP